MKKLVKEQLTSLVSEALDAAGLTDEGVQRLLERSEEFKSELSALVTRFAAKAPDYTLAQDILGEDFLSPEEIASDRGLSYTDKQIAHLKQTLPDKEALEWCRDNGFMLVAGPPSEMSLLDIRELNRSYFYRKEGGWYAKPNETFARNEKVTCRWYMIRKDIVPYSTSKTWSEQEKLLPDPETSPTAAELVWGIISYKAVRSVYLLRNLHARTLSVDSYGYHVYVGGFDEDGLSVSCWNDNYRYSVLGVASARKS